MWRARDLDEVPIAPGPAPNGHARSARAATAICWLAALACDGPPPAATTLPGLSAADSTVAAWVQDEIIPGAVLVVARDDEVLLRRAYGWAQLYAYGDGQYERADGVERMTDPVPMSPGTVFDLASVTKVAATTMALMLLADRGAVRIDAPASTYLPDFRGGDKEQITLRHLLTHTAGLRQWVPTYYHASSPEEAYRYVRDLPLAWPVGAERHYSDLGFMLLGRVVERASGRPLDVFLGEELYGPLGLQRTGFRPADSEGPATDSGATSSSGAAPDVEPRPEGLAATSHGNPYERRMVHDPDFGYRIVGDAESWSSWRTRTLIGEVNDGNAFHAFDGVAGHAGLFSTADELTVLLRMLLGGGEVDGRRYVDAQTVAGFLTPALEGQALGWQLPDYAPQGSFGHTGFTGTFVLVVPRDRLIVVLLTNRQNVGVDDETRYPDVGPLQRAVARAIVGDAR